MYLGRNHSWHNHHLGDFRQAFDRFLSLDDTAQAATGQWMPRVDIHEEDQRFVILADVPGIDPANIEVSMDKGTLIIKGERVATHDASTRFTRRERAHGAFERRFALPDNVEAEGITASGKHGVLEVVIPKRAESAPRRIVINTAH